MAAIENEKMKPQQAKRSLSDTQKAALMGGGVAILGMIVLVGAMSVAMHLASPVMARADFGHEMMAGGPGRGGMHGHFGRPAYATVTKVEGTTLTVKTDSDKTLTVKTDDSTVFTKDDATAKLSDIKTGDTLLIFGTLKDTTINARRIAINPELPAGGITQSSTTSPDPASAYDTQL